MNKAFEKILDRFEELRETYEEMAFVEMNTNGHTLDFEYAKGKKDIMLDVRKIIQEVAEEYNNGWIPCSEMIPKPEEEVFILTEKGKRTTAMYEDGSIHSGDSACHWYGCEFEYDDDADDYIIPEGWWEYRHFNPDDVYNNAVDEVVIAWKPLPEPYPEKDDN